MPTEHASFTIITLECPLGAIHFKCSRTLSSCFARNPTMIEWAFIPGFTEILKLTQTLHNGHQHQITVKKSPHLFPDRLAEIQTGEPICFVLPDIYPITNLSLITFA